MGSSRFEDLRVYQLAERLADKVWDVAVVWERFARNTVGEQLVGTADSVGANIAEGAGRGTYQDNRRFVRIARGSLNETKHFLRRAYQRKLINDHDVAVLKPVLDELGPKMNAYLKSIGKGAPVTDDK